MRKNSLLLGALGLIALTSCTQPDLPAPGISSLVPVIGFSNAGVAKALVPATMDAQEMAYLAFCPALVGFNKSAADIVEGQNLEPQPFLDTTVNFTVGSFTGGAHGVPAGVRYQGQLADGSGSFLVEIDSAASAFYYEEKIFIDDPQTIVSSAGPSKTILRTTISGSIGSDRSLFGKAQLSIYAVTTGSSTSTFIGAVPACEYFAGPWGGSDASQTGAGCAFTTILGQASPDANYNGVDGPSGTLDATLIDSTLAYVDAWLDTSPTPMTSYSLMYKTNTDSQPIMYRQGSWGSTTITSVGDAMANLPSPTWRALSQLDTY